MRSLAGGAILAATLTIVVGSAAPASPLLDVTITAGPAGTVTVTDAELAFSANEVAAFRCSLDGAPLTSCRSPMRYSGLAVGAHRFVVEATNRDAAGVLHRDEDVRTWVVEPAPTPTPEPSPTPVPEPPATSAPVPGPPALPSDLDGDRVPAGRDACAGTVRRAHTLWSGCSVADLVRGSHELVKPVLGELASVRKLLGHSRELRRAQALIGRAARTLEDGDPCDADRSYTLALRSLGRAVADTRRGFLRRRARVAAAADGGDDVSPADLGVAILDLKRGIARDASAAARRMRGAFSGPCRAQGERLSVRGRVRSTDDPSGTLTLDDGRALVLTPDARRRGQIAEGAIVRATGSRMKDGSVVADEIAGPGEGQVPDGRIVPSNCLALRIAPVQPLPPLATPAGPIVLHYPEAYASGGSHVLELGMRVASERSPAAHRAGHTSATPRAWRRRPTAARAR